MAQARRMGKTCEACHSRHRTGAQLCTLLYRYSQWGLPPHAALAHVSEGDEGEAGGGGVGTQGLRRAEHEAAAAAVNGVGVQRVGVLQQE